MQEKVRIVITFHGEYQRSHAVEELKNVRQALTRHNPLEEPYIVTEVSNDNGQTWETDLTI